MRRRVREVLDDLQRKWSRYWCEVRMEQYEAAITTSPEGYDYIDPNAVASKVGVLWNRFRSWMVRITCLRHDWEDHSVATSEHGWIYMYCRRCHKEIYKVLY